MAVRAAEIAFAAPLVMGLRMARLAAAGAAPTPRDRREMRRMVAEKHAAFGEAWTAMAARSLRAHHELALALALSAWSPWLGGRGAAKALRRWSGRDAMAVAALGLAPVHRRVAANARRLGRAKAC